MENKVAHVSGDIASEKKFCDTETFCRRRIILTRAHGNSIDTFHSAAFHRFVPANAAPYLPPHQKSDLATLNLILAIWGYVFFNALASPISILCGFQLQDSWQITYPIRALQLLSMCYCIFFIDKGKYNGFPWTRLHTFLFFVLMLDYGRCFFDMATNNNDWSITAWDVQELYVNPWKFWLYKLIEFLSFISVAKTIHRVDLTKFLKWMIWGCFVGCLFSIFSVEQSVALKETLTNSNIEGGRFTSGVAMHTLALGSYGISSAMLGTYYFLEKTKGNFLMKIISIFVALLGFYVALKAASRGVFIELFAVSGLYLMSRFRYAIVALPLTAIIATLSWSLRYHVIEILGKFNPTIENRLLMTIDEGDTSGRTDLWREYWKVISDNPILGAHETHGAHNQLLDCFTSYGLFLGWVQFTPAILAVIFSYKLLKSKTPDWWPAIFMAGPAFHGITGGGFYTGAHFSLLIVAMYILNKVHYSRFESVFNYKLPKEKVI